MVPEFSPQEATHKPANYSKDQPFDELIGE